MNGDDVKRLRDEMKLSQAELAERLGVSRNLVTKWESGTRRVRAPYVKLIEQMKREKGAAA